ncbi:MAG TPA: AraC family transcriptional regulator [Labilithrix sp.]|nr:AraC family transcriptional regulator [Labilithrix sp.]
MSQDPELLRRLLRAKDRMDAASHEEWSVQRLARVSGVSEAHFARSFKEAFGTPPHRYLLTRRIERAKELLRETDPPITEIAFRTGWNSMGTFGRTFCDVTGESPGELRARARAAPQDLERRLPRRIRPLARAGRGVHARARRALRQRGRRLPGSFRQRLEDDSGSPLMSLVGSLHRRSP